jgi:molybdopterin synthase sulfur carrier subunit
MLMTCVDNLPVAVVPGWPCSAVNQAMASLTTPLGDGDEVAFFPPVTGG